MCVCVYVTRYLNEYFAFDFGVRRVLCVRLGGCEASTGLRTKRRRGEGGEWGSREGGWKRRRASSHTACVSFR